MPNLIQRPIKHILFLGDCNTLGTPEIEGNAYPEQLADQQDRRQITNCGHTMTTCREGYEYFKAYQRPETDLLCVQYGLVDSWLTFKYSPYVLYYPDSAGRKWGRKLVKKFKKLCKRLGLNRLIGVDNVVPAKEYQARLEQFIINMSPRPVVLIETIPNKDTSRNPEISRYNSLMKQLSERFQNCYLLPLYADFDSPLQDAYCDPTHLSVAGHKHVAQKLAALIDQIESSRETDKG